MAKIAITTSGYYVPSDNITTDEIVASYNAYVETTNKRNAYKIEIKDQVPLRESSVDFIKKASGINNRRVINKAGILSTSLMRPAIKQRSNDELSLQAEMGVYAARHALAKINKKAEDVDAVIVSCTATERAYPAIAIEIQKELGIEGWAFDMNAACSSATFGLSIAYNAIKSGTAKSVLVLCPELYTSQLNYADRKSHFIFGDACSALLVEEVSDDTQAGFEVIGTKLFSSFSNNIRNNFGILNRCENADMFAWDKYFVQNGRAVRTEVVPKAAEHILEQLDELELDTEKVKRLWMHQANINMNNNIAKTVLNTDNKKKAPSILEEYGNTGAAGVVLTFDMFNEDLQSGDIGVICSFGAGYTVGSAVLRKL